MAEKLYLRWYGGLEPFEYDRLLFHKGIDWDDGRYVLGDGFAIVIKGTSVYVLVAQNDEYYGVYEVGDFYDYFLDKLLRVAEEYRSRYRKAVLDELANALNRMKTLGDDPNA